MKKYCFAVLCGLILLLMGTAGAVVQDTLRPVDDLYANQNEWQDYPVPGDRWGKIADVVSDDDDSYLYEDTDNEGHIYRADDWSGDGDPDSVEACFLIRKAEAFNTFTVAIGRGVSPEALFGWCGDSDDVDTVTEGTQSFTLFCHMFLNDPCTGEAWTTASLNSDTCGFGIRYARGTTRAIGRYTQGYVVVYSPEAAEGGNPLLHRKKRMGGIDEANTRLVRLARLDRVW